MWQALISPITSLLGQALKNKAEEKAAVHTAKMQVIQNTASWEQLMAQASATSWKDEWFTLLLSAPVVALMWGIGMNDLEIIERIGIAFTELDRLPDWYQYLLFMAVSASFGIRGADKLLALKGKKQMAEELDIFQDTTEEQQDLITAGLTDLARGGDAGFLGLDDLNEGKPPEVIQGEDGQLYRNNPELTASGWVSNPDYSTPVYYFHQPIEVGDARGIYAEYSDDYATATQQGRYYTEEEIKAFWEGTFDSGTLNMDVFREQHPDMDFETYMEFVQENSNLYYEGFSPEENPEMFSDLTDKYGIQTSFIGETGHAYGWNGSNYTKTYHASKTFEAGDLIMSLAVSGMTAGLLNPTIQGIFGTGFAGGAVSGAVGSAIAQGVVQGEVDVNQLVTAGIIGGIGGLADDLVAGVQQTGAIPNAIDNAIWDLSGTLGMSYEETLRILQGVAEGAVTGADLTSIVAGAVGGYSEAKIAGLMRDYFGDSVDIDNFFREGDTTIPVEALTPLVGTAVQGLLEGGVSDQDILMTVYDFFKEGGSLDFLLPALPELNLSGVDIPSLCEAMPNFPGLCTQTDLCEKNEEGEKPWYCQVNLPDVCPPGYLRNEETGECEPFIDKIECPEGLEFDPERGECIQIPKLTCPDGFRDVNGECLPIDIECPPGLELDPERGECIQIPKITCPDGFRNVNGECLPIDIECPPGLRYDPERGECIQIPKLTCPDGFRDENGECVRIEGPDIEGPDIELPDVSLPKVSIGTKPLGGDFKATAIRGLSNQPVQPVSLIQTPQKDYVAELNGELDKFFSRNMKKSMFEGMI